MQRDGINIFCFITLHKERNIQQSLPTKDGGREGDKHNLGKETQERSSTSILRT